MDTLCGLSFMLTLSVPWGALRWGTNRRPRCLHKLKPCDMWKLQEVKGSPSLCSLLYQSRGKEKELAINHEIMTVHLSMVVSPLGLAQCSAVSRCVSLRVWGKVNTHMADHVNQSSSQQTCLFWQWNINLTPLKPFYQWSNFKQIAVFSRGVCLLWKAKTPK